MQKLFRVLLYISLLIFAWYLYRADYIVFSGLTPAPMPAVISILLLFAGFTAGGVSWALAMKEEGFRPGLRNALVSHGYYVFSKYIPGKLWVVLGRASWMSRKHGDMKGLALTSLQEQFVFVWWGMALSIAPTILLLNNNLLAIAIILLLGLLSFMLFSGWFHARSRWLLGKVTAKEFSFRPVRLSFFLKVSIPVLLFWLLWSAGFWFLVLSVHGEITVHAAFAWPAAMTYGFVVVFLPAGLAVREGILVTLLMAAGITAQGAVTVSVIARLWFMAGELYLFLLAVILNLFRDNGN